MRGGLVTFGISVVFHRLDLGRGYSKSNHSVIVPHNVSPVFILVVLYVSKVVFHRLDLGRGYSSQLVPHCPLHIAESQQSLQ